MPMIEERRRVGARLSVLQSNVDGRRPQIAAIQDAYIVTGGANDPVYGCPPCIPRAAELPPGRFRLVKEFPEPDPVTSWRFEAFRLWQTVPPASP